MHDETRRTDDGLLRYLIGRIDALEEQVRQLSRIRDAVGRHARHDPVFAVLNEQLDHHAEAEAERIIRNATDTGWIRSGETFTVTDLFLNVADDPVEVKTICTVIYYEGREVPDSIYCQPSDWIVD